MFLLLAFMYDNLFFAYLPTKFFHCIRKRWHHESGDKCTGKSLYVYMYVINILFAAVSPHTPCLGFKRTLQHVKPCDVSLEQKEQQLATCTCIEFTEKLNHKSHLTQDAAFK